VDVKQGQNIYQIHIEQSTAFALCGENDEKEIEVVQTKMELDYE